MDFSKEIERKAESAEQVKLLQAFRAIVELELIRHARKCIAVDQGCEKGIYFIVSEVRYPRFLERFERHIELQECDLCAQMFADAQFQAGTCFDEEEVPAIIRANLVLYEVDLTSCLYLDQASDSP